MPGTLTAWVERSALDDALDLGDDDAAVVVRGHGLGARPVERQASFSMLRLPCGSAVVARINATLIGVAR